MKHTKQLITAAVMLGTMTTTQAAPPAPQDLIVKATIKTPACTVDIAGGEGGGTVRFDISRSVLSATETTAIPSQDLDLIINCPHKTIAALHVTDNVADKKTTGSMKVDFSGSKLKNLATAYDATSQMFGLGMNTIAGQENPVGAYALAFGVPTVDGTKPDYILSFPNTRAGNGGNQRGADGLAFHHNEPYIGGGIAGNGIRSQITSGKAFVYPMAVAPSITQNVNLDASNDVQLNGHANIEVVYL